jgi:hypothetical protein
MRLCGTAPLDASSGKQQRHRLNRSGDRQANSALWRNVITRLSYDPATRDYLQRRCAEGRTKTEAIRCLERYPHESSTHASHPNTCLTPPRSINLAWVVVRREGNVKEMEMAKFVLMFHGGESPEEPSSEVMDRWMKWFGDLGDAVVDMGSPFGASATIDSDGAPSPGTGDDPPTGYTIIEATNLHDAVVLAEGCPGLVAGGSVKLYEAARVG